MTHHDGHKVSQATVLRLLRDDGLILPSEYQKQRRELAKDRKAAFAKTPTGPNQVWQLDFSEFETTTGGTWRIAGCRDWFSKVEHPFRVIKCQFGHRKVRYRGLAKNTSQLLVMFALSNLWMVRKRISRGLQA